MYVLTCCRNHTIELHIVRIVLQLCSKLDLHWDISTYPRIVVSTILALILDFLSQNYRRVAEIWMDEYKEYVYKKRPGSRNIDMGEASMRGYDKRRDFSTLFNRQGTSANNWSCENG